MNLQIKLEPGALIPIRSTKGAAGWDVFAHIDTVKVLQPGSSVLISTGVSVALPKGHYWDLRVRSGLSTKHDIMLLNGAAVIDEDYRGIVHVPLINMGGGSYAFKPGEKIAQVILKEYKHQDFELVDDLPPSERGENGFGSTGK